ncbi:branched-chain amino acid ABC transporter permease [Nocardioides sp. S5]|uniref:branched-chain amino acid ABC transporter permease n=1 Tax=Nocardioides sp. S5 TaxID=2017486 RepID=UPI001A902247|nr:branched-chain amino acid ABC transporter permease [Nocardioides sp. S5]
MAEVRVERTRPRSRPWTRVAAWVGILSAATALGLLLPEYQLGIAVTALVFGALCQAWHIQGGLAGQFSFAHGLYIGCGAYSTVILSGEHGWPFFAAVAVAVVMAVAFSSLLDALGERFGLKHLSFALLTLAVGEVGLLAVQGTEALGGHAGIVWLSSPLDLDTRGFFFVLLGLNVVTLLVVLYVWPRRLGLEFRAVASNEVAASGIGVAPLRVRLAAGALSAGFTAIAGAFYGLFIGYVDPLTFAGVTLVIQIVLYTVIGGAGTRYGPLIGPLVAVPVVEVLRAEFAELPGLAFVIFGLAVVAVILLLPGGLAGLGSRLRSGRRA